MPFRHLSLRDRSHLNILVTSTRIGSSSSSSCCFSSCWHGCKSRGATGTIAPPRICQEGLNITQAPQDNDEIASLPSIAPPTSKRDLHPWLLKYSTYTPIIVLMLYCRWRYVLWVS